jgi:hypothetical protein
MKSKKLFLLVFSLFVFYFITIDVSNSYCQLIYAWMKSAKPTGAMREYNTRSTRKVYEYEVKVEWEGYGFPSYDSTMDLWRSSSPDVLHTGFCLCYDVHAYDYYSYYDGFYNRTLWHLYFEYYDWVLAGAYYYKAEGAYGEVSVTINP